MGPQRAEQAEVGARIACEGIIREIRESLGGGLAVSGIDSEKTAAWHLRVRELLIAEADCALAASVSLPVPC